MTSRKKGRIGSSFDDFLKDEGVYNQVETVAVKRVIAWQLEEAIKARRMSKLQMARRIKQGGASSTGCWIPLIVA